MGYGRVVGQCGTCFFAKEFSYADSKSDPEDGVHCISLEHAKANDEKEGGNGSNLNMSELTEYGFMTLWRLEAMAKEDYRCPHWLSKEVKVFEQMLPSADESPLTDCPGCGKEYNIMEEDRDDYVKVAPHIFRHTCGQLITFTGGV